MAKLTLKCFNNHNVLLISSFTERPCFVVGHTFFAPMVLKGAELHDLAFQKKSSRKVRSCVNVSHQSLFLWFEFLVCLQFSSISQTSASTMGDIYPLEKRDVDPWMRKVKVWMDLFEVLFGFFSVANRIHFSFLFLTAIKLLNVLSL